MKNITESKKYQKRWAMYQAALQTGLPIVSRDTCAIICAMLVVWGETEEFTHNHRLVCELQYAQQRFGISGGNVVGDTEFAASLQYYVRNLQQWQDEGKGVPPKIDAMFKERYGFCFNNHKK